VIEDVLGAARYKPIFFTLIKAEEKLKSRFHGIKKNGGKV
jgi:hypothetical protein